MFLPDFVSRFGNYYRRHGFKATVERIPVSLRRWLRANRMVVFYWDLTRPEGPPSARALPPHLSAERKDSLDQIAPEDWQRIVTFWNPDLTAPLFIERLRQGASIWLLRSEGKLAAYGWSVVGYTLEPYYYPLAAADGYLYDFLVFPEFRGRQLNSWLITHILAQMAASSILRVHFEVAEWNQASLSSTAKTGYRRYTLGIARKTSIFGRTFVEWAKTEARVEPQPHAAPVQKARAA